MDASGFLLYPFFCVGFIISGILAQIVGFLLSRIKTFTELPKEQVFFIKVVIFLVGATISYFVISYIFRDLYAM